MVTRPGDIIIRISKEEAEIILNHLPGSSELYEKLADVFVDVMENGKQKPPLAGRTP